MVRFPARPPPTRSCGPFFVHCQHGSDRTGVCIAAYRIVVQGWTKQDAIREMTGGNYGFHGSGRTSGLPPAHGRGGDEAQGRPRGRGRPGSDTACRHRRIPRGPRRAGLRRPPLRPRPVPPHGLLLRGVRHLGGRRGGRPREAAHVDAGGALRPAPAPRGRRGWWTAFRVLGPDAYAIEEGPEGLCVFAYRGARGQHLCSLHSAALEAGLPPQSVKPDCCFTWPLSIATRGRRWSPSRWTR